MKAGIARWFPVLPFVLDMMFTIPSFAQRGVDGSSTSPAADIAPRHRLASVLAAVCLVVGVSPTHVEQHKPGTISTTTVSDGGTDSWQHSASDAAHNAELAAEKAYNQAARDVHDVALQAKVLAVLHENKSTRDSDVHVAADNGIITLTGSVLSESNAQRVQEVVGGVYGVKAVKNDLSYPHGSRGAIPPDADSMGVAHPAYSDTAPAEKAPAR